MSAPARSRWLGLAALCLVLFGWQMWRYEVIQDDAYISLVYARHLSLGLGLEFNPGERVEGYTNFLWTLLLVLPHWLDLNAARVAQILGGLSGIGVLFVGWGLGRQLAPRRSWWASAPAPLLLAANGALAFWSLSGLETSLFVLLVSAAAWCYVRRGQLDARTGALLGLATLTRPEGAMFAVITGLHQLLGRDRSVKRFLADPDTRYGLLAGALLVVPHLLFRSFYYGDIVPNTFHAKTGISITHLDHGIGYVMAFLRDYGFGPLSLLGVGLLIVQCQKRAATTYLSALYLTGLVYSIAVGGDTLAEKRLLLPILPFALVITQEAILRLAVLKTRSLAGVVTGILCIAGLGWTIGGPHEGLLHARRAMAAHNGKLHDFVDYLQSLPRPPKLVASTAIGIPRYFGDVDVLDLVGLTDTTIARHPVRHTDIRDDHILRNYHVDYVLDRAPEYIFFIAGSRPATPAERALFLSPQFRRNYILQYPRDDRPVYALQPHRPADVGPLATDGQFAELFSDALASLKTNPTAARTLLLEAVRRGPEDFEDPHYWLGHLASDRGDTAEARQHLDRVIDLEPDHAMAHVQLAALDLKAGHLAAAIGHGRQAYRLAPQSSAACRLLGRALLAAGQLDEAIQILRQAIRQPGGRSIDAMLYLGIAEEHSGNTKAARLVWEAVLAADPGNAEARARLSRRRP